MKIAFGCDHAGFFLKETVLESLKKAGHTVLDMGTDSTDSVDYPDYAYRAAKKVSDGEADLVIVVCGSGIGVSITANKAPGVRCALCMTPEMAALARQHNNANGLAMGARLITPDTAEKIISTFLSTDFEAGRHERRVKKIHSLSNC